MSVSDLLESVAETTALVVLPASALPTILAADANDILGKLAAKVAAHRADISTEKGRGEIRTLAAEIASGKVALVKLGKSLTEGWRKSTTAVNQECNLIEERMSALRDQVRAPLTAFENAEKARVAAHEEAVKCISGLTVFMTNDVTTAEIEERYIEAQKVGVRDWQEFGQRAADTRASVVDLLASMLAKSRRRDEEQAELARLREEEAKHRAEEAARLQAEREAQIAADAAAEAKRLAEEKTARDAEEAERKAEAERQRIIQEAEVQRKAADDARIAAEAEVERKVKAEREATERREQAARDALERAEREKAEALEAARLAAERAEKARIAAAEKSEADRQAAVKAEQKRVADEVAAEKAAADRRAANVAHKGQINREALAPIAKIITEFEGGGIIQEELAAMLGKLIITAIAKGEVPHVRIEY